MVPDLKEGQFADIFAKRSPMAFSPLAFTRQRTGILLPDFPELVID
jgi:hypothetical protein